jgi:hypothetical protein
MDTHVAIQVNALKSRLTKPLQTLENDLGISAKCRNRTIVIEVPFQKVDIQTPTREQILKQEMEILVSAKGPVWNRQDFHGLRGNLSRYYQFKVKTEKKVEWCA